MPPEPSSSSRRPCCFFPDSVLLDPIAHIGGPLRNATTAATLTSALSPIELSFDFADPPGFTRCVVTCPELPDRGGFLPRVLAADGAFILLVACFPRSDARGRAAPLADYFVYKAGPGAPSLLLLPPAAADLYSNRAGVLSFGGGGGRRHCFVIVPEISSWTAMAARMAPHLQGYGSPLLKHEPTKVFPVRDPSLTWVDLSLGVLLCDVLGGKDGDELEMRPIDLPPLLPTNVDPSCRSLPAVRDVFICRDGWIRCIEIELPWTTELSEINNLTEFPWTATVSKRVFSSGEWETFTVDSDSLSPGDSCFADLFPEIRDDGKGKLTLNKVISVAPVLDHTRKMWCT